jgi:hypothetical protein
MHLTLSTYMICILSKVSPLTPTHVLINMVLSQGIAHSLTCEMSSVTDNYSHTKRLHQNTHICWHQWDVTHNKWVLQKPLRWWKVTLQNSNYISAIEMFSKMSGTLHPNDKYQWTKRKRSHNSSKINYQWQRFKLSFSDCAHLGFDIGSLVSGDQHLEANR